MHAGTILFNGTDLSSIGRPRITIRRQPEPPAAPTRNLVTLTVSVAIEARDPGTVQARLRYLQETMNVGEGILACGSDTGHSLEWLATPAGDNLQEAITGNTNTVDLVFSATENLPGASLSAIPAATFTPAGGTAIHLHAIREMKQEIRSERHSERASARRATVVTRSFKARVAQANPADGAGTRLAWLQSQAAAVAQLNTREGILVYGDETNIVRVQQFSPVIDEGRGVLDVEVQCYHVVLPDPAKAEGSYDIRSRTDEGSGEDVITVSGIIEAETRAIALGKLEAIRTAELTGARRLAAFETSDRKLDGADSEGITGADWSGALNFSFEIRSPLSGTRFKLKISTTRDIRSGMRETYTGSVQAPDEGTAVSIARGLTDSVASPSPLHHRTWVRSEESVEMVTDPLNPATVRFVKLDFTYEFEGTTDGFAGGEITWEYSEPRFGEWRLAVNGFFVAKEASDAEARLAIVVSWMPPTLEYSTRYQEIHHDPTQAIEDAGNPATITIRKLEFSANSRTARGYASAKFTDNTTPDPDNMMQVRTVSGSLWSDTEANAETAFSALMTALFGGNTPQKIAKTHHRERSGSGTTGISALVSWVQLDFTAERTDKLAGTPGFDIIEASYQLERVGSIQKPVITPIPFARPVAQSNVGWYPGVLTLTARCKARLASTARTWVQGKRSLATAIGSGGTTRYESGQPRESSGTSYAKFSGTEVTTWDFSGTYQWTFTGSELDSIWPSGQGGVS